jgi:signal transduction histidine kinase
VNLRHRAEKLGGTLEIQVPDDGGTLLVWSVPS